MEGRGLCRLFSKESVRGSPINHTEKTKTWATARGQSKHPALFGTAVSALRVLCGKNGLKIGAMHVAKPDDMPVVPPAALQLRLL